MFARLRTKLLLIFLFIGVLPILVVGSLALRESTQALQRQAFAQLISMREVKKNQIESYFERAFDDIQILAGSEDTRQIQKLLKFYAVDEEIAADQPFYTDTYEYGEIWSLYGKTLTDYVNVYGYREVFIIQADTGHLVFSAGRQADLGANLKTGELAGSHLAALYNKVVQTGTAQVQDFHSYGPQGNAPAAFIGSPVVDLRGTTLAVAVLQLSLDEINNIMGQRAGMGDSGETYLVGPDLRMRSDLYQDDGSHSVVASFSSAEAGKIDTQPVKSALLGETGDAIAFDYKGAPILTAYTQVKFGDLTWALVAEMDEQEAFAAINELKYLIALVLLGGVLLIVLIAMLVTRSVTRPILDLTFKLESVARTGDYNARIKVRSRDELGQSAAAFNTLMEATQTAVSEIKKVMEGLAKGDFSNRIEAELKGELLSIKEAINTSLTNVEESELRRLDMEQEARVRAEENARVRQALDNASTNIMIANANYEVIYINRASKRLMQDAKQDFKTLLPGFEPERIIGSSIDMFHARPEVQREILEQLDGTFSNQFPVGSRVMGLAASAIIDDEGSRIGTVIEWQDRTAEVAIEREIDAMVDAAGRGDFSRKLSREGKKGFQLKLIDGLNRVTGNIDAALADMQRILGAMANGDLTQRIEKEYSGRLLSLKQDSNATIDKLTDVIGNIRKAAATITNSSNEIADGNRDLSQRTEAQASSLQETAASMDNMTDTVKQSAENALKVNELSEQTRSRAREGGEIVERTILAMEQISGASNKISDIIGVIDAIAFQTNLLALNAAVEAARAGDQGRGFAVVAGEVRNLAQRSAEAAKEIKELIRDTNEKVLDGSELVNESGETLKEIVSMVEKVGLKMSGISDAAQEHSAGIEQVNIAIARMDAMTQQNSALVEQAAVAAESMTNQARDMSYMMEFFTINDTDEQLVRARAIWRTGTEHSPLQPPFGDNWDEF
ncbi:methyl-accepting chemotaxis protein [Shewanella sp. GXUN23E]|uniref:methyl-accepting chemotaxis protein n=1 Tax=Shewanella sp. GXUN23E TaxID=3422498 RepID=UPI003D7E1AD0